MEDINSSSKTREDEDAVEQRVILSKNEECNQIHSQIKRQKKKNKKIGIKSEALLSSYDPHHLKCFFKYMKKLIKAGKAKKCTCENYLNSRVHINCEVCNLCAICGIFLTEQKNTKCFK